MPHTIRLTWDETDREIGSAIDFFERRRYVARQLVPHGYEKYFQDRARFLSAHTSTAIEGNRLDAKAAQLVLIHRNAGDRDTLETRNSDDAYALLEDLSADPSLRIDQGLIRAFNSILLKDIPDTAAERRGMFRPGGCLIIDSETREIRYTAPPPEWLPDLMDSFVTELSDWCANDPPLIAAAKAHFGLISIHPFDDGNGRTARLLADLILRMTGMSVDGMLSVNSVLLTQRDTYYEVLRSVQGPDFESALDITGFIRFHTNVLTSAVAELEDRAVHFNMRRDYMVAEGRDYLDPRQVIGLMYMLDLEPLSTSTYAKLSGCSVPTARSDLRRLAEMDIVQRMGSGKRTRYTVHPAVTEAAAALSRSD